MIHAIDFLTTTGNRKHSKFLDVVSLKQSHVKPNSQPYDLIWTSVLMLIDLDSAATYKTLILSKDQGLILMKQSTTQLIKDYANSRTPGFECRCPILGEFLNIKEYIPHIFNHLQLAPLKIIAGHHHPCYIAVNHLRDMYRFQSFHSVKLVFDGLDLPVVVPVSLYFIEQRLIDIDNMRLGQKVPVNAKKALEN